MRCGGQQPNSAFAELAASAACAAALAGRRRCGSNARLQRAPNGIGVPFCVRISWPEVRSPCHTAQHTAWRRSGRAQQGVDATRSPCHRAAASLRLARRDAEQQRTLRYSWSLWPGGAFGAPIMLAVANCSAIAKVCSAKGQSQCAVGYCSFTRKCCEFTAVAPQLCCCIASPQMLLNHSPLPHRQAVGFSPPP
jgi:hypothetical protein